MSYWAKTIQASDFKKLPTSVFHQLAFGEIVPDEMERADFCLLAMKEEDPIGYVTCIEMDKDTLYWQLGGAFPDIKKTSDVVPGFISLTDYCLEKYERISVRVENDNFPMLKMAMKMGFKVVGTWNFKNRIYLQLLNEKGA